MNSSITQIIEKIQRKSGPGEILWSIKSDDGSVDFTYGDSSQPFFIASATKLYVTAILTQLRAEGTLNWDSPITDLLTELPIRELTGDASVRELMAHTSGLGDYFEGTRDDGPTTFQRIIEQDSHWDVNDVISWTHHVNGGVRGKGLYSDTGYQLLGALIEHLDKRTFADSVQIRIVESLGLSSTYVFSLEALNRYDSTAQIFEGKSPLQIPLAMASVQADGGIVTTLADGQEFLRAFFDGQLFPFDFISEIEADWHPIFRPLEYGTGIMRFQLPPILTGFRRIPAFVGHSGASGVVMFRCPDLELTIVGTINQVSKRSLPYQLMVRTALAARK